MEVISHAISDSLCRQKTMFLHRLNTRQSKKEREGRWESVRGKGGCGVTSGPRYNRSKWTEPGDSRQSGQAGKGSVWRNKCTGSWWMVSDSQQNTAPVKGPASHVWLLPDVESGSDLSQSISPNASSQFGCQIGLIWKADNCGVDFNALQHTPANLTFSVFKAKYASTKTWRYPRLYRVGFF